MNAVDRFDQLRSTNPIRRREKRLSVSIFTWILDVSIHNAYVLYTLLYRNSNGIKSIRNAKEELISRLVSAQQARLHMLKRRENHRESINEVVGGINSNHIFTKSNGKLRCRLCRLRGGVNRVRYACTRCEEGFHLECFIVYHYKDIMTSNPNVSEVLEAILLHTNKVKKDVRVRKNTSIVSFDQLTLPQLVLDVRQKN
jgi:hypothetical protein